MNSADQKNPGFSVPQGLSSKCLEGKSRVFFFGAMQLRLKAFDEEGREVLTVDYLPVVNVPDVCVWLEKNGLFAVLSSEGISSMERRVIDDSRGVFRTRQSISTAGESASRQAVGRGGVN